MKQNSQNHSSGLLTAREVCEQLRLPRSTVYYLTQIGKIRAVRIGKHWRYRKPDIDQFLNGHSFSTSPERRRHPRLNVSLACRWSVVIENRKLVSGNGHIQNMSQGGILVSCEQMNVGAQPSFFSVIPAKAGIQNLDPFPKVLIGDQKMAPRLKHSGATKSVDSGMTPNSMHGSVPTESIEPDDPIELTCHEMGTIQGRVVRVEKNGHCHFAVIFRHLPEEMKQKIREFIG